MNIYILMSITALFLFGYCKQKKKETIKNKPAIEFYYRDIGSNNGYYTYFDYLKVLNYENNELKIKQMVDLANRYVDSAKSDKPIAHITFIGQPPSKQLPPAGMKFSQAQAEYLLISFGYNTTFKENEKSSPKLISMDLWKDGEAKYSFEDRALDSIINLNEFINNKE